jgi:hypothetical protein
LVIGNAIRRRNDEFDAQQRLLRPLMPFFFWRYVKSIKRKRTVLHSRIRCFRCCRNRISKKNTRQEMKKRKEKRKTREREREGGRGITALRLIKLSLHLNCLSPMRCIKSQRSPASFMSQRESPRIRARTRKFDLLHHSDIVRRIVGCVGILFVSVSAAPIYHRIPFPDSLKSLANPRHPRLHPQSDIPFTVI